MDDNAFRAGDDDLPRTVRQQKEARAREMQAHRGGYPQMTGRSGGIGGAEMEDYLGSAPATLDDDHFGVVNRFQVPFFHLMFFLIKVVLAAIPALFLLGAMLYGAGLLLQKYLPWLVKLKILIEYQ